MIEIDMSTSATVFSFVYVYISRRSTVKEQDNSILGNKLEKIYKIKYLFIIVGSRSFYKISNRLFYYIY